MDTLPCTDSTCTCMLVVRVDPMFVRVSWGPTGSTFFFFFYARRRRRFFCSMRYSSRRNIRSERKVRTRTLDDKNVMDGATYPLMSETFKPF